MKKCVRVFLLLVLVPSVLRADPIRIVDTGPGPSGLPGWSLYDGQRLAAEFSVASPHFISSIEGWIGSWGGGAVRFTLYDDGGNVPGNFLFGQFGSLSAGGGEADWRGILGLSWFVQPGTYWVAFEPPGGSTFSGFMPMPSGDILLNGAFAPDDSRVQYFHDPSVHLGVRILGDPVAPVPEPASLLLLGAGIAGLALKRRRTR